MTQYISRPVKPVIAEAIQFDTSKNTADHVFAEIEAFVGEERAQRVTPLGAEGFSIYHEGIQSWLELKPTQYVIVTDGGYFYPVDQGIFEATYQPLSEVAEKGEQTLAVDVVIDEETGKAAIEEVKSEEPAPKAKAPRKPRKTAAERAAEAAAE